jgi:hypothetical protein
VRFDEIRLNYDERAGRRREVIEPVVIVSRITRPPKEIAGRGARHRFLRDDKQRHPVMKGFDARGSVIFGDVSATADLPAIPTAVRDLLGRVRDGLSV